MDIDYINIILVDKQRKVLKVFPRTSDHRSGMGPKPPLIGGGGGITQYAAKLPGITQKFGAEHQKIALKMVNLKQKRKFFLGLRKKILFGGGGWITQIFLGAHAKFEKIFFWGGVCRCMLLIEKLMSDL